ncbi:MAG: DUF1566 domain-containing protein, partial [Actinomycetota bacterium]|nr:DUF1566 domain-containing protein [Actinomycetota bacterium]
AFLPGLNTPPCFAEHCDWRLPNVDDLKSILIESHPCGTNPCTTIPGETSESVYWSSSAYYSSSTYGWLVYFNNGLVNSRLRSYAHRVRAVRGGS